MPREKETGSKYSNVPPRSFLSTAADTASRAEARAAGLSGASPTARDKRGARREKHKGRMDAKNKKLAELRARRLTTQVPSINLNPRN